MLEWLDMAVFGSRFTSAAAMELVEKAERVVWKTN
jgi:hypothetical protein